MLTQFSICPPCSHVVMMVTFKMGRKGRTITTKIDTRKELPNDKNVNVITFARKGGRLPGVRIKLTST